MITFGQYHSSSKSIKVVVVANLANTNCLICATNAPSIPKENFCALTRLDFNRYACSVSIPVSVPDHPGAIICDFTVTMARVHHHLFPER